MKQKKTIYLAEENEKTMQEIKRKYGLSSESDAINYLLAKEREDQAGKIAEAVRKELEENYLQKDRIKWATQTAEQNSIIILDAINTLLYKEKLRTCISADLAPSPVVTQSKERIKEKIHYFKEKSDERKSKKQAGVISDP